MTKLMPGGILVIGRREFLPTELQALSWSVVRQPFFKKGRQEGAETLTANLISAEAGFIIKANFIIVAG